MAAFNFTNTKTSATVRLKPWTINPVIFKGVELKTGTNKDGEVWKAIQFKFSGDSGIFEPMFFCPKDGGDQRPSGKTGDREWVMPSQVEQLSFNIAHVVGTLAPANFEKLKKVSLNLPEDFEKLVKYVQDATKSAVNTSTNIKLVADSRGYAAVPNVVNIHPTEGYCYLSDNWIGENLAFSAYEIKKMNQAKSAKPTNVDNDDLNTDSDKEEDNSDLDFDI